MGLFDREVQESGVGLSMMVDQPEDVVEVDESPQEAAAPTSVEKSVRVVYIGEPYTDDTFGSLQGGDERTVSSSEAEELVSRESNGKPLFAVI